MTDPLSPDAPQPAFLIGAPRSGTTWIQRLLQSHPAICGGEESHFFTLLAQPMNAADQMAATAQRAIGPLVYCGREGFDQGLRNLWAHIFAGLYAENPAARVHLEKTPFHALTLTEIHRLFPKAPVILLLRDSRAVAASLVHAGRSWGRAWAPDTAKAAALEWSRHVSFALDWHRAHPEHPFLVIRYEDALADPRTALATMLEFLLPPDVPPAIEATFGDYEAGQAARVDPEGFSRMRGADGWHRDLSWIEKLVVWRFTRKKMKELGYGDIAPFR